VTLDAQRTVGQMLSDALALYRADWRTYLLVVAVVIVPAELVVTGLALGELSGPYQASQSTGEFLIGVALQQLVTVPLSTAMAISVLLARLRGETAPARAAIQAGLDLFPALLLAVVLVGIGVAVGLMVLLVPGIFLAVRLLVTVPAVVIEGRRAQGALERSWTLTRGAFWHTLATILVVNLVALVGVAFLVVLPFSAVADTSDAQAVALAGSVLGQLVAVPLTAIATALLFGDLRARRAAADAADAGTPAAAV
jgi:hypothetical protein